MAPAVSPTKPDRGKALVVSRGSESRHFIRIERQYASAHHIPRVGKIPRLKTAGHHLSLLRPQEISIMEYTITFSIVFVLFSLIALPLFVQRRPAVAGHFSEDHGRQHVVFDPALAGAIVGFLCSFLILVWRLTTLLH
ncbi:hypothetical protein Q8F57_007155 [Paraburkholderia terrae]|uniref:hypothetical protein n=1 Tax=Paraburkholderia terrae TaxID=311230 RepID=UPI00296B037A|nr:hypothetical protein [Paraburkholderia terrae]MDW3663222.1 hypothetical protein [Paraburkholderia terrae]